MLLIMTYCRADGPVLPKIAAALRGDQPAAANLPPTGNHYRPATGTALSPRYRDLHRERYPAMPEDRHGDAPRGRGASPRPSIRRSMKRTRHLRTDSRDSPVRLRDKACSDARSASDKTSGTSFGLGTSQACNLQTFQRLRHQWHWLGRELVKFAIPYPAQERSPFLRRNC